jgi:hypothetical protein
MIGYLRINLSVVKIHAKENYKVERLTKYIEGCSELAKCRNMLCEDVCIEQGRGACNTCTIAKGIEKLAEYENSKLTPAQCKAIAKLNVTAKEIKHMMRACEANDDKLCIFLNDKAIDVYKCEQWEKADREKRLVELPFKAGDTVYATISERNMISEMIVTSITIYVKGFITYNWEGATPDTIYPNVRGFDNSDIGRTVFLTGKEAEKSLAKEQAEK